MNIRSIDLNLLGVFDALMNEQNLTYTAQTLSMSQSAVSHALNRLRVMYNDPLFERKSRKMQPTRKALEIYPLVAQILEDVKSTLPNKKIVKPNELNLEYRINLNHIDNRLFIHQLMAYFALHAQGITLKITSDNLIAPEVALRNREYDLHIDMIQLNESGYHSQELFSDKVYVVARKEHPRLKALKTLNLEQYLLEKHAVLVPKKGFSYVLNEVILKFPINRDIRYKSENMRDLQAVVACTDLLCIIPGTLLQADPQKNDYIWFELPFDSYEASGFMNWYWGVEHYPAHRYIRNTIKQICNEISYLDEV